MPRPGLRLRGRVPKPPLWPQTPIVARSDRPTDADVGTARLAGATDAARRLGRWGRGGRALSSSGRGSEPRTCAQAQPSRKSRVAGGWSRRCHPLPESDAKAAGSRAPGLRCRKGRAVTVSWIGNIAPSPGPAPSRLRPGLCPRPAPRGVGLSHPGSERVRPLFPHPSSSAQRSVPLAAVSAFPRTPEAGSTPPGLCFIGLAVRSVVPLTHI